MLKAENDTLKTENHNRQSNLQCLSCSSRASKAPASAKSRWCLSTESYGYYMLQLDRLHSFASMRIHPPPQDIACFFPETDNHNDNDNHMLIAEEEKAMAMDLALEN